jgi:hypothetical protein
LASFSTTTGKTDPRCHLFPQRFVAPSQIRREQHPGPGFVDPSGRADANRGDRVRVGELGHNLDDEVERLTDVLGRRVTPRCGQHLPV